MKNLISLLLFLLLLQCGYQPIYNKENLSDVNITVGETKGDSSLNNLINSRLKRYSSSETDKIYTIDVNTSFSKSILSKDAAGKATKLKLSAEMNFKVIFDEKSQNYLFEESINIDNLSDKYEQNNYENIIKNNFVDTVINKLLIELSMIKWL